MTYRKRITYKYCILFTIISRLHGFRSALFARLFLITLAFVPALFFCGCTDVNSSIPGSSSDDLVIFVQDHERLDLVQKVAGDYTNASGGRVIINTISPDWDGDSADLFGDILITDMAHIPAMADQGHIVSLNSLLGSNSSVNWTVFESPTLSLVGEYPDYSGKMYALPFYLDALGIVYRGDLFDDPDVSDAFCLTYGYPMAVPGSYRELSDLAGFFSQNGFNLSGIAFAGLTGPDPLSSPWLSLVSSYGSHIIHPVSGTSSGSWNSSNTVSALLMLRNLSNLSPDGAFSWGDTHVADAFSSGKIAMGITWFSRFDSIESDSKLHNISARFIPLVGEVTDSGSYRGITVKIDGIAMIEGGNQDNAISFLTWFYSPDVQMSYAKSGIQPSLIPVLDSFSYLSLNGYNRAFPESMRVGVTAEKGQDTPAVRFICEESVQEILSMDDCSEEKIQDILDASVARIDLLTRGASA